MRELDRLGLVESDPFVLLSGDVVSNIDLRPAIEGHKARKLLNCECGLLLRVSGQRREPPAKKREGRVTPQIRPSLPVSPLFAAPRSLSRHLAACSLHSALHGGRA